MIPRQTRRRPPARLVAAIGLMALVLAIAAGVLLRWPVGEGDAATSAAPHRVAAQGGPSSRPAPVFATPTMDWVPALVGLDALRAKAFATRDAGLLREVYVRGPLLNADSALLTRLVPPGCSLVGARTRYGDVHASVRAQTVLVTARATLPASKLVCTGQATRRVDGVGPVTLHVELTRTAAGLRIADQQVA